MVKRTDRPSMTIAVDLGRKATKQTKQENITHKRTKRSALSQPFKPYFATTQVCWIGLFQFYFLHDV